MPGAKEEIQEYIKDASLFVLSSDYEGIPNALIEAMAIGLPCVSTDCSPGGARELIVNGKDGFIVPCGDAQKLADAIRKMINDKSLARECGTNARQICQRTAVWKISEEWMTYICGTR